MTFFGAIIAAILWLFFYAGHFNVYQNIAIVVVILLAFIAVMGATWGSWGMRQTDWWQQTRTAQAMQTTEGSLPEAVEHSGDFGRRRLVEPGTGTAAAVAQRRPEAKMLVAVEVSGSTEVKTSAVWTLMDLALLPVLHRTTSVPGGRL